MITDMNQPLGKAVGNSLEVIEAIETLKGQGPEDITELSLKIAGIMIFAGGKAKDMEEGYEKARTVLENGEALEKMRQFIKAQGGNPEVIENYALFPQHTFEKNIVCDKDGYVNKIAAKTIGIASQHTGAGREKKEDDIDLSAGIYLNCKCGEKVSKGQVLATVYGNNEEKVNLGAEEAKAAFVIGDSRAEPEILIKKIIH